MKKLHSFAFYALVAPIMTFSASSVLAQQPAGQDVDRQQQSTQREQGTTPSTSRTREGNQHNQREQNTTPSALQIEEGNRESNRNNRSDSQASDHRNMRDQSRTQNREYLNTIPARGSKASNLIGADVQTTGNEGIGSVDDLIIDNNGQVVAIVVSVGGFLGMGQKDVAIGWDNVTRSGTADKQELRVDMTREELRSAPEFKKHK